MRIRVEDLTKTDLRSVTVAGGKRIAPTSPGEMLRDEFLRPMGLTNYRLAKEIDAPARCIGDIIAGKRGITADADLRLCRFFGLTDGWWRRPQSDYDTRLARTTLAKKLAKIKTWSAHPQAKAS